MWCRYSVVTEPRTQLKCLSFFSEEFEPEARSGHRIVADNGNLYSIGGYNPKFWGIENDDETYYPLFREVSVSTLKNVYLQVVCAFSIINNGICAVNLSFKIYVHKENGAKTWQIGYSVVVFLSRYNLVLYYVGTRSALGVWSREAP